MDPVTVAVAGGNNHRVLLAIVQAFSDKLLSNAIITGDRSFIEKRLPEEFASSIQVISSDTSERACSLAVEVVRKGDAEILIKGNVDSTSYLRAIVDRQNGIRQYPVLSNITIADMPSFPKLLGLTDNGIVPIPDLKKKKHIIENTRHLYRGLGIAPVKVVAVAATEKISSKLVSTTDAAKLADLSGRGKIPGFIVDGPYGYDVAVNRAAAKSKHLDGSPVAGAADLLLFPNIDSANAVAKSWKYHGKADCGSIVLGASVPVLLNSRSDNASKRLNALMLAVVERLGRSDV